MNWRVALLFIILFDGCKSTNNAGWRQLDARLFTINAPGNWKLTIPQDQEDSFVGEIVGPKVSLSFDCSSRGYANDLKDIDSSSHHIKIDSSGKFLIKTIYPKKIGQGMTGIYIKDRSSTFDFQMNGMNLSAEDQQSALKAFKTITFKQ
ncbi:hypothetical protein FO440_12735 [Mucilaginibacter corticis]|uniref:Uncharacterized protein n=1 Tax=Mucilaginibacter corticis TaxID=2597670 RepID=A0A556ML15_9SPHI|nr:hypothetical protein [Mucilaginibacter corticis]TSJ40610.1 hypothetical protein FO440_12735 [Mucilaginibacter corticis]